MTNEAEARKATKCICGERKDAGAVVCWTCFKYRNDLIPLKWYPGTFEAWQAEFANIIATTQAAAEAIEAGQNGI